MTDLRTKEAIRYLGYGKHAVDEGTLGLISDSLSGIWKHVRQRNPSTAFLNVNIQGRTNYK